MRFRPLAMRSGFIFTTALPPALAAGAVASIQHLKVSQFERARHQDRVRNAEDRCLTQRGIPHMPNPSHIVPVLVGDAAKCKMDLAICCSTISASMSSRSTIRRCQRRPNGCASPRRRCIPMPTSNSWSQHSIPSGRAARSQGRSHKVDWLRGHREEQREVAVRPWDRNADHNSPAIQIDN